MAHACLAATHTQRNACPALCRLCLSPHRIGLLAPFLTPVCKGRLTPELEHVYKAVHRVSGALGGNSSGGAINGGAPNPLSAALCAAARHPPPPAPLLVFITHALPCAVALCVQSKPKGR